MLEKETFKLSGRQLESFTPLNILLELKRHELLHIYEILIFLTPKTNIMGLEPNRCCKFHKFKEHHTKYFYQLKKEIERLIQEGNMKKYAKNGSTQTPREYRSQGIYAY